MTAETAPSAAVSSKIKNSTGANAHTANVARMTLVPMSQKRSMVTGRGA